MNTAIIAAVLFIVPASVALALIAAAETALEQANDVRLHALAARGDRNARRIASGVGQPGGFLGPLTVGRVLLAAAIVSVFAWLGARGASPFRGAAGFGMIGGAYVALVQTNASLIATRAPEYASLRLAGVIVATRRVFIVPAAILGLPAGLVARSLRLVAPRRQDDLLSVIEREEASGGVEEQGQRMIKGVIALEDKSVREIMIPRIDIGAADVEDSIEDVAAIVNERGFSRVPIYRENVDDIIGIVYAKDLLRVISTGARDRRLETLLRPAVFVPESKRVDQLLAEMRTTRQHMAIVVDEYGGTAGLVTIEDLLEEIVGEIEDEYDIARPALEQLSPDEVVLDASMPTDVLEELFDYRVESDDFDTVGGLLLHELGRLPSVGDEIDIGGLNMRVLSMSGRRVRRLRIARHAPEHQEAASAH